MSISTWIAAVAFVLALVVGVSTQDRTGPFTVLQGTLWQVDSTWDAGYFAIGQKSALRVEPYTPGWYRIKEILTQGHGQPVTVEITLKVVTPKEH